MWHLGILGSVILFLMNIPEEDHIYTADSPEPIGLTVGFILMGLLGGTVVTINLSMLTKSIASVKLSRGIFLSTAGVFSSMGIILIDQLGGHLYDNDKRNPWLVCIGTESLLLSLIIVLAIFR